LYVETNTTCSCRGGFMYEGIILKLDCTNSRFRTLIGQWLLVHDDVGMLFLVLKMLSLRIWSLFYRHCDRYERKFLIGKLEVKYCDGDKGNCKTLRCIMYMFPLSEAKENINVF